MLLLAIRLGFIEHFMNEDSEEDSLFESGAPDGTKYVPKTLETYFLNAALQAVLNLSVFVKGTIV